MLQKMQKRIQGQKKKGFTLVELIVVIAILAILALILVPTMTGLIDDANKAVAHANARTVYTAAKAAITKQLTTAVAPTADNIKSACGNYLGDDFKTSLITITLTDDAKDIATVKYDKTTYNGDTFTDSTT